MFLTPDSSIVATAGTGIERALSWSPPLPVISGSDLPTPPVPNHCDQYRGPDDSSIEDVARGIGVSPDDIITAYRSGQLSMELWLRPNDVEAIRGYFRLKKLGPALDRLAVLFKSQEHADDANRYKDRVVAYALIDGHVIADAASDEELDGMLSEKKVCPEEVVIRRFFDVSDPA